jgi:hypothetical protein
MRREDYRRQLSPPPHPGRWLDLRLVEYQLSQHNIRMPQTYSDEERCARWMQMGFSLFRRLEGLGYRPCPDDEQVRQSLEVYPHACYTVLLGHSPFPKASLEDARSASSSCTNKGRGARPDALFEEITRHKLLQGVPPEEGLYTAAELDALVAAFTA